MKRSTKIVGFIFIGIFCFLVIMFSILFQSGFQSLPHKPYPLPKQRLTSWDQILKAPLDIKVETLLTGVAEGDRFVVLDETDPNIKEMKNRYESSTVLAHWIQHPDKGNHLVDAGLAKSFATGKGNYNRLLNLIMMLIGAKSHQPVDANAASQLAGKDVDPESIFLTHLHADHTSGVVDFKETTKVVFGKGEPTFMQRSMMGNHLSGKDLLTINFEKALPMPPFEKALDIFGDGSFWAISTSGHSPDHISYLVNTKSGPILIVRDAAAYYLQFEHQIRPSPQVYDVDSAIKSLSQLNEFVTRYPQTEVLVGHEFFE